MIERIVLISRPIIARLAKDTGDNCLKLPGRVATRFLVAVNFALCFVHNYPRLGDLTSLLRRLDEDIYISSEKKNCRIIGGI